MPFNVPAVAITQAQPNRQCLLYGKIPARLSRYGANLFHCQSPLLRFECVDNLGAYSIPSRDRPSHLIC